MKYMAIALVTGVTLLWCAPPLRADETSKSAKAEELLQLTQGDQMMKMMEPMMKGMLAQMDKDMPAEQRAKAGEMQGKMMALVAVSLSKAKPALAKVYADTYTEEEIDGILAFYKSPAGKVKLEAELDATDQLEFPSQNSTAIQYGLHPQLAQLEMLINPTSDT